MTSITSSSEGLLPESKPTRRWPLRGVVVGAIALAVLLTGWFVWPTMYLHSTMRLGVLGMQTVRTNRFSGEIDVLDAEGKWARIYLKEGRVTIPAGTALRIGGSE